MAGSLKREPSNLSTILSLTAADRRFRLETIRLFRSYLSCSVRQASPLLLDLSKLWQLDLAAAVGRLRPPPGWPMARHVRPTERHYIKSKLPSARWLSPIRSRTEPVMQGPDAHERLAIQLNGDTLDTRARLGETMCTTANGMLEIWLPMAIPETLQSAMIGRHLSNLVSHPVLLMRDYRVLASMSAGGHTVVEAHAPALPFAISW